MPKLIVMLIAAAAASLPAGAAANAQSTSGTSVGGAPAGEPGVTVQGPERLLCRVVRRTGTRMRASRVCRTVTQWEEAQAGRSQDEVLAEAADTLETFGDKVSTNCVGTDLDNPRMNGNTPLGPR